MRKAKQIGIGVLFALISKIGFGQQLRLGNNPFTVEKSAVLELVSTNQGLLLPRIADTSLINTLAPPDGMIIFHSPSKLLLIRSNSSWKELAEAGSVVTSLNGNTGALTMDTGYISNFYSKVRSLFSATAPITYNSSTGVISITQAGSSSNGYLSSTDWNTFNNKLSSVDTSNISNFYLKVRGLLSAGTGISYNNNTGVISNSGVTSVNGNTGALTMDTSYISNFYLKVRALHSVSAPLTYNSATGAIAITQATTSTNGYLSSADWNTFNNKLGSVDTSNISNFYLKVRGLLSAGTGISYNNNTGVISNSGVTSVNGNTGALTMDTSYISNFYLKVRALHSVSAPLTYNSATGAIAITQATTSTNGYLSSTDWNTFNNKLSSVDTSNISNFYLKVRALHSVSAPLTYNSATGAIAITQATTSTNGYLSSADWNTFNNKLSSVDTSNISNFYLKVRALHSVSAPLTYNSATGAIAITQATTSTNGYLSSTDWNTFNNKLSSVDTSNISNFYLKVRALHSVSAPLTYNSATGAIAITQATTSTNGYLSSTDWNTFNNKQASGNYMTDPGGNGIVARTSLNTTTNRTITGTTNKITVTNGDGVSGNPTINVGGDIVDETIANTYTAGAKQTFVNSATTAGLNLSPSADPSTPASGDFWNSTTTANSLKYRDAASTTRTLVDLSLSQTLTNKTLTSSTDVLGGVTMTLGSDATGDLYYRNSSGVLTRLGIGSAGDHLITVSGLPSWTSPSTYQATPADPATTTSTTGRMMGLAGSITPAFSGTIMITISGDIDNATANDGAQVQIRYGTGTAPTNGAFLTGTTSGSLIKMVSSSATNRMPFHCNTIVSGLTVGTAYWIDLGLAAITGGTARIRDVSISAIEL